MMKACLIAFLAIKIFSLTVAMKKGAMQSEGMHLSALKETQDISINHKASILVFTQEVKPDNTLTLGKRRQRESRSYMSFGPCIRRDYQGDSK
jgi:putative ubiquitin-RnfH superfamily antitoxin RatB of RatAB toxin-antitoxin module